MPERAVITPESGKLGAQPKGARVLRTGEKAFQLRRAVLGRILIRETGCPTQGARVLNAGERTFRLRRAVLGRILVGVGKRAQVASRCVIG